MALQAAYTALCYTEQIQIYDITSIFYSTMLYKTLWLNSNSKKVDFHWRPPCVVLVSSPCYGEGWYICYYSDVLDSSDCASVIDNCNKSPGDSHRIEITDSGIAL